MIGLIATDFDGTIHSINSMPRIATELVNWLRYMQGSGTKWAICTGRQLDDEFAAELGSLKGDPLPDFVVTVEREIQVRHNGWYAPDEEWNARCAVDHAAMFGRTGSVIDETRRWLLRRTAADVYEDRWSPLNIVAADFEEANKIARHITESFQSDPELILVRNSIYFRIASRQYTKGTALAAIARKLGLEKHQVFAAGDHFNDITMLDGTHAGLVAAPANAIPEVKAAVSAAGGYVAKQPYSLGVLEALRFFDRG